MNRRRILLPLLSMALLFACGSVSAQREETASMRIDIRKKAGDISPLVFGQFIEHLGRSITGGIYEEGSPLSDSKGFRRDVLDKIKGLHPTILRYPGGTYTKIYHWKDGVGPVEKRPRKMNLIWGGIENNRFGTDEFLRYCRELGCEPFIVVNMGTGTPEEAADWVEYCNGTADTYYANLRRSNGHAEPYNVRFWGLGNEEYAVEDAGHLQNPARFVDEAWQFVKLMKLTDPSIKLVMPGNIESMESNRVLLNGLGPVTDYLSLHYYAGTRPNEPASLFQSISNFETLLRRADTLVSGFPSHVKNFPSWYRFPARQEPIGLSVDEWGIWESGGKGTYNLETSFGWRHALATASFLNVFLRNASVVRMATWSQTVNVLGCIISDKEGSVCQTVYYPLQYYREYCSGQNVDVQTEVPAAHGVNGATALDAAGTYDEQKRTMTLFVVNRDRETAFKTTIALSGEQVKETDVIELTGESFEAANTLETKNRNVVKVSKRQNVTPNREIVFRPGSITVCVFRIKD
jgi:alpha-N-arabinofuranosidase